MDGDSQKDSSADHLSEDGTQRNLDELPEQEIKKLKNRHSTQLSRKRRKLYEDLLEEKYNDLNNQYKNEIQKLNLNNSLSDKMKKYISFLRQKKVIESKMEESIARDALDKEVIGKILMDGVLYRLGPKGHTRESLCNLLVSMIIDEIFPEPYKFVFCLLNNEHMKDRVESAEIMKLNTLMHEDQLNLLRDHFGEEIMSIKSRYNSLIEKLTALKRNILDDQKDIENLLHHAANIVSSTKRSNYVNFIEFCILGNERLDAYFEEHEEEEVLKKRRPPVPENMTKSECQEQEGDIDKMLMSQIKMRRIKQSKKQVKKSDSGPYGNGHASNLHGKAHRDQDATSRDLFDMKKEHESTTLHEESGAFDFDEGIFSKYYSGNRDELSHLFLQNEDDVSMRFPVDD